LTTSAWRLIVGAHDWYIGPGALVVHTDNGALMTVITGALVTAPNPRLTRAIGVKQAQPRPLCGYQPISPRGPSVDHHPQILVFVAVERWALVDSGVRSHAGVRSSVHRRACIGDVVHGGGAH